MSEPESYKDLYRLLKACVVNAISPEKGDIIIMTLDSDDIVRNEDTLRLMMDELNNMTGCDVLVIPSGATIDSCNPRTMIKRLQDLIDRMKLRIEEKENRKGILINGSIEQYNDNPSSNSEISW